MVTNTKKYNFSKKGKAPSDENAPKRPLTAFMAYSNKHRAAVQKMLPEGSRVGDIAKKLGEMWKACTGAERTKFDTEAKAAKAKYDKKFAAYKETEQYAEYQEMMHAYRIHKTKLPFRKDPNHPKKAKTAYMLFGDEHRPAVMEKFKGQPITATMTELSKMWKAVGEDEKAKWNKKAAKAKADREKEVEKYMKTKGYKEYQEEKEAYKAEMARKRAALERKEKKKRGREEEETDASDSEPARKPKKAKRGASKRKSKSRSRSRKSDRSKKSKKSKRSSRSRSKKRAKRAKSN